MTDLLLALMGIAAAAAWACSAGSLPGRSFPLLGPLVQGLAWAALYAGLVAAYRPTALRFGAPPRGLARRLALCLLLALATTHGIRLLAGALVAPSVWERFFYVQWLVPPAMLLLTLAALMPRTTGAVIQAARAHPVAGPLLGLAVLLAWAAALTAAADLAFEWHAVDARLRREIVLPGAWVTNTLLLFCAYALVFAATSRVAAAQLLVTPVYLLLAAGTLLKIEYMHSAVQPLDLLRLPEFAPLFPRFFGTPALVATVVGVALWLGALATAHRRARTPMSPGFRLSLGLGALALLLGVILLFELSPRAPMVNRLLIGLGAPSDLHREKARANGLLMSFLSEIPAAAVPTPPRYSPESVAAALRRSAPPPAPPRRPPGVNLVVYLIESFMDPNDLGLRYSRDPIPQIRAAAASRIGAYAIVPERFGGSANTEFELLSGMSMAFLPQGSLPFRQYIRRPLPSLPRALADLGYATTAVQADAKYYYNREQVYAALGFRHVAWLSDTTGVERGARAGWPPDAAVVRAVIDASRGPHPFFVFAFPSSTHSPYNAGTFRSSDLDVTTPVPSDTAGEVKEYINALQDADAAVGTLLDYFRRQPDSTIIAILGDHLAPLSGSALGPFLARLSTLPEAEQSRRSRRVPLVVWANFPLPAEGGELSVNALPSYLMEKMGITPAGLLGLTAEVRRRMPVVGPYVQGSNGDVWTWDALPDPERSLLEDYRLLQYDLLLGNRYALGR